MGCLAGSWGRLAAPDKKQWWGHCVVYFRYWNLAVIILGHVVHK